MIDFECAETDLEETFLGYYGPGDTGSDTVTETHGGETDAG
ncbi:MULTISPECIES: hypothetical protein [unclassified Cryobacterium]|nr:MULTISPECIES: hypothetical protein [unclassified Cryobacterium]